MQAFEIELMIQEGFQLAVLEPIYQALVSYILHDNGPEFIERKSWRKALKNHGI